MTRLVPWIATPRLMVGAFLIMLHTTGYSSVGTLLAGAEISAIYFTVSPNDMPLTGKLLSAGDGDGQGLVSYQGETSLGLVPGLTPLFEITADDLARSSGAAAGIAQPDASSQVLESRFIDPAKIKPGPIAYLGLGLIALALMRQYRQQLKSPGKQIDRGPNPRH